MNGFQKSGLAGAVLTGNEVKPCERLIRRSKLKIAEAELQAKTCARYPKLTETEIKMLLVDNKWLSTLVAAVQGELDRISQMLTGRIRQLAERYATPLPQLTHRVAALAAKVDEHLKRMGAVW